MLVTGGTVDTSSSAAYVGRQGARMSSMSVRHWAATSPRVPPSQSLRVSAVQVWQVYVSLLQPVDAQQPRQVSHQRLPVPLCRLPVCRQILPFTQGSQRTVPVFLLYSFPVLSCSRLSCLIIMKLLCGRSAWWAVGFSGSLLPYLLTIFALLYFIYCTVINKYDWLIDGWPTNIVFGWLDQRRSSNSRVSVMELWGLLGWIGGSHTYGLDSQRMHPLLTNCHFILALWRAWSVACEKYSGVITNQSNEK